MPAGEKEEPKPLFRRIATRLRNLKTGEKIALYSTLIAAMIGAIATLAAPFVQELFESEDPQPESSTTVKPDSPNLGPSTDAPEVFRITSPSQGDLVGPCLVVIKGLGELPHDEKSLWQVIHPENGRYYLSQRVEQGIGEGELTAGPLRIGAANDEPGHKYEASYWLLDSELTRTLGDASKGTSFERVPRGVKEVASVTVTRADQKGDC